MHLQGDLWYNAGASTVPETFAGIRVQDQPPQFCSAPDADPWGSGSIPHWGAWTWWGHHQASWQVGGPGLRGENEVQENGNVWFVVRELEWMKDQHGSSCTNIKHSRLSIDRWTMTWSLSGGGPSGQWNVILSISNNSLALDSWSTRKLSIGIEGSTSISTCCKRERVLGVALRSLKKYYLHKD